MIKVQFISSSPEDVEGFPVQKTFKGALHLMPYKVYSLAKEEYAHIRTARPELKFVEFKEAKIVEQKQVAKTVAPVVSENKELSNSKEEKKKK